MKLNLPRFGLDNIEIDPNTLIEFQHGVAGFENCQRFKLFHSENNPAVFWLQSVDDANVVFSLSDPVSLQVVYNFPLTEEEQTELQIEDSDELQIAVILLGHDGNCEAAPKERMANFMAPVVINVSKRKALQKTLQHTEYLLGAYQTSDIEDDIQLSPATDPDENTAAHCLPEEKYIISPRELSLTL